MERQEMQLTPQGNHLRGEVESFQSEIVNLEYEIVRHQDCGSDIANAHITVSVGQRANADGRI
jgi:hypothetical protein